MVPRPGGVRPASTRRAAPAPRVRVAPRSSRARAFALRAPGGSARCAVPRGAAREGQRQRHALAPSAHCPCSADGRSPRDRVREEWPSSHSPVRATMAGVDDGAAGGGAPEEERLGRNLGRSQTPRSARLCGCSYRGSLWHYTPFFTPRQGISVRDQLCVSASSSFARRRNACAVFSRFPSPRHSRAADTVHNLYYRHRCPVHGTAYASLFLHPSASVITQLGQSCSAATRLSLHKGRVSA